MSNIEILENVPGSYEDFVIVVNRWMEKDPQMCEKVLEQLNTNPNSSTSDILKILWEYLEINESLEILDE